MPPKRGRGAARARGTGRGGAAAGRSATGDATDDATLQSTAPTAAADAPAEPVVPKKETEEDAKPQVVGDSVSTTTEAQDSSSVTPYAPLPNLLCCKLTLVQRGHRSLQWRRTSCACASPETRQFTRRRPTLAIRLSIRARPWKYDSRQEGHGQAHIHRSPQQRRSGCFGQGTERSRSSEECRTCRCG